jgi:hypothetical protein
MPAHGQRRHCQCRSLLYPHSNPAPPCWIVIAILLSRPLLPPLPSTFLIPSLAPLDLHFGSPSPTLQGTDQQPQHNIAPGHLPFSSSAPDFEIASLPIPRSELEALWVLHLVLPRRINIHCFGRQCTLTDVCSGIGPPMFPVFGCQFWPQAKYF